MKLLQVKRFGQIVVNAVRQTPDAVVGAGLGGKDENRKLFIFQANALQNRKAIDPRQHDVKNDQVRPPGLPLLQGRHAIRGDRDIVTQQGEIQADAFGNMFFILDDQNTAFRIRL